MPTSTAAGPSIAEDETPAALASPAYGEVDLLTVLEHMLGLADNTQAGDLMDITLALCVSRSPTSEVLARTVASGTSEGLVIRGGSLRAELKLILDEAARPESAQLSRAEYRGLADQVRAALGDRPQADEHRLLAEDRMRSAVLLLVAIVISRRAGESNAHLSCRIRNVAESPRPR